MDAPTQQLSKKKRKWLVIIGIFVVTTAAAGIALFYPFGDDEVSFVERMFATSITLSTPPPIMAGSQEDIVIDVVVNRLPNQIYPAASLSVHFDSNYLAFTGIRQGTMRTVGNAAGTYHIPLWHSDVDASNERGFVNTMYLDMTGGDQPYIIDENDILLRLVFRLRESASAGDVYHLVIEDAVFATIDPADSVGTSNGNLRAFNAQIIVE